MNDGAFQWASKDAGTLPWLAVTGYLVAAGLCWFRRTSTWESRERLFWLLSTLFLLGLGINKQLDLQTALTELGRRLAISEGWYGERRAFQQTIILVGLVVAPGAGLVVAWLLRGMRASVFTTLLGLSLLGAFVIVRAASFHHVDVEMRTPVFGLKLHTVLELAGIAVVILSAGWPRSFSRST